MFVRLVVIPLDGRLFDGAVHAFDLSVGPRVPWLGETVFDVEVGTGQFEGIAAKW